MPISIETHNEQKLLKCTHLVDYQCEEQKQHWRDEEAQDGSSSIAPCDQRILPIEGSNLIEPPHECHRVKAHSICGHNSQKSIFWVVWGPTLTS